MFGPKTDPRSPPSPYMLNHNGRSPYVKYRLAVNIYLFIKYFFLKCGLSISTTLRIYITRLCNVKNNLKRMKYNLHTNVGQYSLYQENSTVV
jgi:hypothetical protein